MIGFWHGHLKQIHTNEKHKTIYYLLPLLLLPKLIHNVTGCDALNTAIDKTIEEFASQFTDAEIIPKEGMALLKELLATNYTVYYQPRPKPAKATTQLLEYPDTTSPSSSSCSSPSMTYQFDDRKNIRMEG